MSAQPPAEPPNELIRAGTEPAPLNPSVSPAGSSVGWSWATWARRQKSFLKGGAAVILGYLSTFVPVVQSPEATAAIAFGVGLISRALLDRLDFWLSDVALEKPPTASAGA